MYAPPRGTQKKVRGLYFEALGALLKKNPLLEPFPQAAKNVALMTSESALLEPPQKEGSLKEEEIKKCWGLLEPVSHTQKCIPPEGGIPREITLFIPKWGLEKEGKIW